MKLFRYIPAAMAALMLCACSADGVKITVRNNTAQDRMTEMVEIPIEKIAERVKLGFDDMYVVHDADGSAIPSQWTADDKLIFQPKLGAGQSGTFTVTKGPIVFYDTMAYGRFVPERLDDYAWENDRVAFRAYGQALIEKDGPSNGLDVWYKRTDKMIIDKWYYEYTVNQLSYHRDHGEGMDDYKVGRSLGAGAMAPLVDSGLVLNDNFVSYNTIDNGPLRVKFELVYNDLDINGQRVSEKRTITLDAGSQLSKVTQEYGVTQPIKVAAGFPKRGADDSFVSARNWIVYEEPATNISSGVYMGLIFPDGFEEVAEVSYSVPADQKGAGDYTHILAVMTYNPGHPVTYYTGFGWQMYGFPTLESFRDYIENYNQVDWTITYE